MFNRFYKLKSRIPGFVLLPKGGTMQVVIPAGSVVNVLCACTNDAELVSVRHGERSCTVKSEELRRCGSPIAEVPA
jgi:hypothetical protein